MDEHSWAWLFFIPYLLIATFMMLNLFIAVIVNAMQDAQEPSAEEQEQSRRDQAILDELKALRAEIAELRRNS